MNILKKPYTTLERADFVYKNSMQNGLKIFETETALYAVQKNETVIDDKIVEDLNYEENQKQEKRKLAKTSVLEAAKIEQILYKATGLDFEDVISYLNKKLERKKDDDSDDTEFDLKALKIELKQSKLTRDNIYLVKMLKEIGYNDEDIDELFLSLKLRAIYTRN